MAGLGLPVVTLVVGGDEFTLKKVAETVRKENNPTPGSVVIVNESGSIANMLADIYKAMEGATKQYSCFRFSVL